MSKDTETHLIIKGNNVVIFWSEHNQGYELRINDYVIDHYFAPESAEAIARQIIDGWEEEDN